MEMNKLSKRTKMFLGIGGLIVVLAVVVVVVFSQLGGDLLFGGGVTVSPSTLTIGVGGTGQLTSSHSKVICKWSSSNSNVVKITSSGDHSANLQGVAAGSATITEKCGAAGRYTGSAVVTVVQPTVTLINNMGTNHEINIEENGLILYTCAQAKCTYNAQTGHTLGIYSYYTPYSGEPHSATCPVGDSYFYTDPVSKNVYRYCPDITVGPANYTATFNK